MHLMMRPDTMNHPSKKRRLIKWIAGILLSPFALTLILALLLYLPPVQRWALALATDWLRSETGLQAYAQRVRLAFPLDLALDNFGLIDEREARHDTVLAASRLRLSIALMPLLHSQADIDGLTLECAQVNTRDFISDTYVRGSLDRFTMALHGANWANQRIRIDRTTLSGANLYVALSDTASPDTTATQPTRWVIQLDEAHITDTRLALSFPGDTMRAAVGLSDALLQGGLFDLDAPSYSLRKLKLRQADLTYATRPMYRSIYRGAPPVEAQRAAYYPASKAPNKAYHDAGVTAIWPDRKPAAGGLDPTYIVLTNVGLGLDSLSYDKDGVLRAGVSSLSACERSGLCVSNLHGSLYMDSLRLSVPALNLRTPHSSVDAALAMDFQAFTTGRDAQLSASVNASIGREDILALACGSLPESDRALLRRYLPRAALSLRAAVSGNIDRIDLRSLSLSFPGIVSLGGNAHLRDITSERRSGWASLRLRTAQLDGFAPLVDKLLGAGTLRLPRSSQTDLRLSFASDLYKFDANSRLLGGSLTAHGRINLASETYQAKIRATKLALSSLLPGPRVSPLTASLSAEGQGFDLLRPTTRLACGAEIAHFSYADYDLSHTVLKADLRAQHLTSNFSIHNPFARAKGQLTANLQGGLRAALRTQLDWLDLRRLTGKTPGSTPPYTSSVDTARVTNTSLGLGCDLALNLDADRRLRTLRASGSATSLRYQLPEKSLPARPLSFNLLASTDTASIHASAGDLQVALEGGEGLREILRKLSLTADNLLAQLRNKTLDQNALKQHLPSLDLSLHVGQRNPATALLSHLGYRFSQFDLDLHTHAHRGLSGLARAGSLTAGRLLIDTLHLELTQDSSGVRMQGLLRNYRRTNPNRFRLDADAYLLSRGAGINARFTDQDGRTGIDLGARAELLDSGMLISLQPQGTVLAYHDFQVNPDNYVYLGRSGAIRANVDLLADDGTGLRIYSSEPDSADRATAENDITLSINHLNLGELSSVLPFLPSLSGFLGGDVHVLQGKEQLSAMASLETTDLHYDGTLIGSLGLEALYLPRSGSEHYANAYIISDKGEEVMALEGSYFDTDGAHFTGRATLLDLPLTLINGFLTGTDIALQGRANGQVSVQGTTQQLQLDGQIDLDSAHILSPVYGFDFLMDERPLQIRDSRLLLSDYELRSSPHENPLVLSGAVDLSDLSSISLDMRMKAKNFLTLNATQTRSSMLFGQMYSNFNGTLRGTLSDIKLRGQLEVLPRTNMSYVLKDSPLTVDDRLADLVEFTSFSDTTELASPPTPESQTSVDMSLGISVSDAARFHCLLSEDGSNYVDIEGGGDLTFRLTGQDEMRLTGRLTLQGGEMKYSLPVIPLKTFAIDRGSYVEFTGDAMNPTLSIKAKERVKAVVSEGEAPRSVAFDVGVDISKPLNDMGLAFIVEAPEDLTVQNQLAAMSAEQRGKTAVALLATGMYLTDDMLASGGSGLKASNALNAFLQNELQNIAGAALRTIDLSVGMEQGTSSVGTTTTDYSFQFSKRFWGDRISVILGGKVSTGQDAHNSAESFIDNIAVEYRLDRSAARSVRLFYDRSTHDPLEGQLTTTGAGLVLRRKVDRLSELFIFRRRP